MEASPPLSDAGPRKKTHLVTTAELNRAGRYDRMADGVERVTGRPAMSVRDSVSLPADEFGGRRS
jgi:hypothetical protein